MGLFPFLFGQTCKSCYSDDVKVFENRVIKVVKCRKCGNYDITPKDDMWCSACGSPNLCVKWDRNNEISIFCSRCKAELYRWNAATGEDIY